MADPLSIATGGLVDFGLGLTDGFGLFDNDAPTIRQQIPDITNDLLNARLNEEALLGIGTTSVSTREATSPFATFFSQMGNTALQDKAVDRARQFAGNLEIKWFEITQANPNATVQDLLAWIRQEIDNGNPQAEAFEAAAGITGVQMGRLLEEQIGWRNSEVGQAAKQEEIAGAIGSSRDALMLKQAEYMQALADPTSAIGTSVLDAFRDPFYRETDNLERLIKRRGQASGRNISGDLRNINEQKLDFESSLVRGDPFAALSATIDQILGLGTDRAADIAAGRNQAVIGQAGIAGSQLAAANAAYQGNEVANNDRRRQGFRDAGEAISNTFESFNLAGQLSDDTSGLGNYGAGPAAGKYDQSSESGGLDLEQLSKVASLINF